MAEMDDHRDDESVNSTFSFDTMNLTSPGLKDSIGNNRQEPSRQVTTPNLERIETERYRQLSDHYRAERARASRLVDDYLLNVQDQIVADRVEMELCRIEDERIETERYRMEDELRERERIVEERVKEVLDERSSGIQ